MFQLKSPTRRWLSQEHGNKDVSGTRVLTKKALEGSFARKTHCVEHRPLVLYSVPLLLRATRHQHSSKETPRQQSSGSQANFTASPSQGLYLLTQHTLDIASERHFLDQLLSRAFTMNDPDNKQHPETKPPCQLFAASGNCGGCQNDHHPNLNPALVGMIAPQQYRVPNEVGVACLTCIQNFREVSRTRNYRQTVLTGTSYRRS